MTQRTAWKDFGWLVVLVATIATVLALDGVGALTYATSLLLWLLPILYLGPLFWSQTDEGTGRRRRALFGTIAVILILGVVLDLVFGHLTLTFLECPPAGRAYVACITAFSGDRVPIEELFFYALGPAAIVLAYACADERWLDRYNPPDALKDVRLVQVSPRLVVSAGIAGVIGLVIWRITGHSPVYYWFLVAGALLPAMFLYRAIGAYVNWPAFAATTLHVVVTSIIWEVTLAIPRGWWGYRESGMIGIAIAAWSSPLSMFPIEAAFVWVCVVFSSVLSYEFAKALTHHPANTRVALFGSPGRR
jgi:hypothetical protein